MLLQKSNNIVDNKVDYVKNVAVGRKQNVSYGRFLFPTVDRVLISMIYLLLSICVSCFVVYLIKYATSFIVGLFM